MVDFDRTTSADLSLVSVARMIDEDARKALMALRWPSSNGNRVGFLSADASCLKSGRFAFRYRCTYRLSRPTPEALFEYGPTGFRVIGKAD